MNDKIRTQKKSEIFINKTYSPRLFMQVKKQNVAPGLWEAVPGAFAFYHLSKTTQL